MYVFGRKLQPKNHEFVSYHNAMDIITSERNLVARCISCMDPLEGVFNFKGKLVWFPIYNEPPHTFIAIDEMIESSWEILEIRDLVQEIKRQAKAFKAE